MAYKGYGAIALTGGTDGALDKIDGAVLADGDVAVVIEAITDKTYVYTLDATSGAGESSPNIISPDTNAGTKRWVLAPVGTDMIQDITAIISTLKTGSDLKLVTGTKGTTGQLAMWNTDGDAVGAGEATAREWSAQQNFNEDSVTSSGNAVAWDWDTDQCTLHTLTENTTISAPTNANVGSVAYLRVVQAAGLYTLAWNAAFDWGTAVTPDEPAASGDTVLFGFYYDGTNYLGAEICRKEA